MVERPDSGHTVVLAPSAQAHHLREVALVPRGTILRPYSAACDHSPRWTPSRHDTRRRQHRVPRVPHGVLEPARTIVHTQEGSMECNRDRHFAGAELEVSD